MTVSEPALMVNSSNTLLNTHTHTPLLLALFWLKNEELMSCRYSYFFNMFRVTTPQKLNNNNNSMLLHVPSFFLVLWVFIQHIKNHSAHWLYMQLSKNKEEIETGGAEQVFLFHLPIRSSLLHWRESRGSGGWQRALLMNMSKYCHQSSVMNKSL